VSLLSIILDAIAETIGDVSKKIVFWSLVILLICLAGCFVRGIAGAIIDSYRISGLESVASRLGFHPSIKGLAEYINATIEPGMTREEVEQALGKIGTLRVRPGEENESGSQYRPTVCDELVLKIPDEIPGLGKVPGTTFPRLVACYDARGGLVKMEPLHVSDAPPVSIYAP